MKGIILAGGTGSRLSPITKGICKQLLPVYDKPLIYYPLSTLMLAGIKDILIIASPEYVNNFKSMLSDGKDLGIRISYAVQDKPRGIADAFIVGKDFIKNSSVALILGDNIFYGDALRSLLKKAMTKNKGATSLAYYVKDPRQYGVAEFTKSGKIMGIQEKPAHPKSHWAITGLYFYDKNVSQYVKRLKPSKRGELEITDLNKLYLKDKKLNIELLGRGYAWLDTGTYESFINASLFIKTIEDRQGLKIGCIEEIAYRMKYINERKLIAQAKKIKTSYGDYLIHIAKNKFLKSL